NENIERIISERTSEHSSPRELPPRDGIPESPETLVEGLTNGDWWPKSTQGLIIVDDGYDWYAHDPVKQRFYYYSFSI
ncbi:MAG: hypothetical protein ACQKBW_11005, partial [Puniceicoccales bacterium]